MQFYCIIIFYILNLIYICIGQCEGHGNAEASPPQLGYEVIDLHPAWDDLIHLHPAPPALGSDVIDLDAVRSSWLENDVIDLHPAVPLQVENDVIVPFPAPPTPLENAPHG